MNKKKKESKYYRPQTDKEDRRCDYPGCNNSGLYKAPKDRSLKEYYWFCLEHVAEYNANWNYYKDMTTEDVEEQLKTDTESSWQRARFTYKDRFSDAGFFNYKGREPENKKDKAIRMLNLNIPFTKAELKKRYKELAKKYHPDTNAGDKASEERFKDISWAYNELLELV